MSDTGGGHRSSADALSAGFTRHAGTCGQRPDHRLAARSPALPVSSNSRRLPVSRQPHAAARHLFWRALERDPWATFTIERGCCWSQPPWRALADHRPDLILSVHPMVQHITAQALARSGSRVPFCTVVTDPATAHRAWFHPAVTRRFVAGPAAQERALAWGIDPALSA
ncbi:MAG: hypothetical protein R2851_05690 [Caldilineaceae bacterium]